MAEWLMVLAPVAGLAVNVIAQVALFRLRPVVGLLRSIYVGFALGLAAALGLTAVACRQMGSPLGDAMGQGLVNGLTAGALGYGYFHFLNLGETARRIRILREVVEAGGTLTAGDLLQRYNARMMVEQRLARLLRNGQVVVREGRYALGRPTVLRMARALAWVGRVLGMEGTDREAARDVASARR
jgi:hypothetical protein